jgi:hypothetical protein
MKKFSFEDFILVVAVGLPLLVILVSLFYLTSNYLIENFLK